MKRLPLCIIIVVVVLVLDQWLKIRVKTNYPIGGGFDILGLSWAKIYFIENKGMAFGLEFGGSIGKYALSIFRIILVGFLMWMVKGMIATKQSYGLIISFSLVIAGAIGNILDSAFYGLIFSEYNYHGGISQLFHESGGYGKFLQGKVVDMLYFPLIDTRWPEWFPFLGGNRFRFFNPVFNIADSAISVGVISILLFFRSYFSEEQTKKNDPEIQQDHF